MPAELRLLSQHIDQLVDQVLRNRHRNLDGSLLLIHFDSVPQAQQFRLILGHAEAAQADQAARGVAQVLGVLIGAAQAIDDNR